MSRCVNSSNGFVGPILHACIGLWYMLLDENLVIQMPTCLPFALLTMERYNLLVDYGQCILSIQCLQNQENGHLNDILSHYSLINERETLPNQPFYLKEGWGLGEWGHLVHGQHLWPNFEIKWDMKNIRKAQNFIEYIQAMGIGKWSKLDLGHDKIYGLVPKPFDR